MRPPRSGSTAALERAWPARPCAALLAALALAAGAAGSSARDLRVPAAPGAAAAALGVAADGDTVTLTAGVHDGPLLVHARLVLRGEPGAVVDGGHSGTVVRVGAPGAVLEDMTVRATGARVLTTDAAVTVIGAPGATVRRLAITDALYGIYVERSDGIAIRDCRLRGRVAPLQVDGEGDGIHLWYTNRPRIERNDVGRFTDAIYLSFVNDAAIAGNRLELNGRYGLHTMYCQASHLLANRFARNAAGCAIMFSNHLDVRDNDFWRNRGPRTYGLLLKDCSDGLFTDNRMVDNTVAVFMDNSNRNRLWGNLLEDNGWGLLIFSSCADNQVYSNSFVNNDYPVSLDMRYTTNRFDDGTRGNYWSENAPYDLDGDGVSDVPFSPVTAFAFVSKQYPDLSILAKSPAVAALAVAERVVPALRPSEAVDRHPLVTPARARGTGAPLGGRERRPAATGAAVGFGLLAAAGVGGLTRARRAP
jgi:nitrous oxidase accessory protein